MTTQITNKWVIDPSHSQISFSVRHLVVTTLSGKFDNFSGELLAQNEDFSDSKITFNADITSINTGNIDRDNHLKSDDFFNAEQFPSLQFKSTSFVKNSENDFSLSGDITIRNITQTITLKAELGGIMVDPWGNIKAGFEISGKINRKEFGLKWDVITEAGGAVVSDEVKLNLNVQVVKQA